jgi:hypothetical protein
MTERMHGSSSPRGTSTPGGAVGGPTARRRVALPMGGIRVSPRRRCGDQWLSWTRPLCRHHSGWSPGLRGARGECSGAGIGLVNTEPRYGGPRTSHPPQTPQAGFSRP